MSKHTDRAELAEQGRAPQPGFTYNLRPNGFDEMVGADGFVREHWADLSAYLSASSSKALGGLTRETQRRLKEQGIHYHVYDDPKGFRRPWQLDPLPAVLADHEWPALEAGLTQRARLFNLLMKDLYGQQRTLRDSLVPWELIYRHPEFLRPVLQDNAGLGDITPMSLYAVDLARSSTGEWWALSDRTQGPSGVGYVLAARYVTKRVLGASAPDYPIAPLAQYFFHLKRHLASLAPDQQKDPTIVLLSPGIGNEVYFEHAYLAAQLGITLVQGDDLTVRQGKVFLKTVDDLRQVDVIIRRVDSNYCDPLSLRHDTMLGVPGLLHAQALGKVGMANAIGSGVLENPALMPFLPGLSRALLGEDLLLPCVATWWCGQERERQHVLSQLEKLIVKTIDRPRETFFGDRMSHAERERLIERIRAEPWRWIGQENITFSTTPTLAGSVVEPRSMLLRTFLAGDGNHYDAMPGGLTRVATRAGDNLISNQAGSPSKDTWLLRKTGSLRDVLRLSPPARSRKTAAAVLTSRAAEHLFWCSRYLERSEMMLRLVRAYLFRLENFRDYGDDGDSRVLRQLTPMLKLYYSNFFSEHWRETELRTALTDTHTSGSVTFNLHRALEAAYTVRDLWPPDSWRAIEQIEELVSHSEKNVRSTLLEKIIQPLVNALLAFWGANQESLALTQGGLWLHLGHRIERIHGLMVGTATLCEQFEQDDETAALEAWLEINSGLNSHRRRYGTELTLQTTWFHLLLDHNNPRSLLSQLQLLEQLLTYLNPTPLAGLTDMQKSLLAIITQIRLADAKRWAHHEPSRSQLAVLLRQLAEQLRSLGLELEHAYFKHTQPLTQLAQ